MSRARQMEGERHECMNMPAPTSFSNILDPKRDLRSPAESATVRQVSSSRCVMRGSTIIAKSRGASYPLINDEHVLVMRLQSLHLAFSVGNSRPATHKSGPNRIENVDVE